MLGSDELYITTNWTIWYLQLDMLVLETQISSYVKKDIFWNALLNPLGINRMSTISLKQ
jgi:hypothetical protein